MMAMAFPQKEKEKKRKKRKEIHLMSSVHGFLEWSVHSHRSTHNGC